MKKFKKVNVKRAFKGGIKESFKKYDSIGHHDAGSEQNNASFGQLDAKHGMGFTPIEQNDMECTLLNEGQVDASKNLPKGAAGIGSLINNPAQEQYHQQEEYESPQASEELAPSIKEFYGEKDTQWDAIDPSALDPVLKCIQGDYTGRFTYLNSCTSSETETSGELIGGKPEYNQKNNPLNLTMYLEDPKLDEVHAHIFCRRYEGDHQQFIIKDLSDHHNVDSSGIWV